MPNITMPSAYFNAQILKDSGEQLLTIKVCKFENVAPDDKPEDMKWVLYFEETSTGATLNSARLEQLVSLFGTNASESWHGKQVTVWCDPDVRFAGKKIGGVAFKQAEKREPRATSSKTPIEASVAPTSGALAPHWQIRDDCYGMLISEVPSDHLEAFLKEYPQASIQERRKAKEELERRG